MLQMYVYAIFVGLSTAWIQSSGGITHPKGWCFGCDCGRTGTDLHSATELPMWISNFFLISETTDLGQRTTLPWVTLY